MKFQPKLTNLQASRAMMDLANGMLQKDVAEKYGVHQCTISRIKKDPDRGGKVRELQPCGTPAAYRRHVYHGEIACAKCLKAWSKAQRDRRPPSTNPPLKPHGTIAAYRRHRRAKKKPCKLCRAAWSAYLREYRSRKKEAA